MLEQYLFNKPAPPQVTKAEVVYKIRGNLGCMTMRGVRKPGSKTVTSALRGIVRTQAKTRSEIMSLIRG